MNVVFLVAGLSHYRVAFHRAVHERLARQGINYQVAITKQTEIETLGKCRIDNIFTQASSLVFLNGRLNLQFASSQIRNADIMIVINENKYLMNIFYLLYQKLRGRKFCLFGHAINYGSVNRFFLFSFKRLMHQLCDISFLYNRRCLRELRHRGLKGKKFIPIFNAIEMTLTTDEFVEKKDEITFVGTLRENKKVDVICEVFKIITQRNSHIRCNIVGDGPLFQLVKDYENDNFRVLGPLSGRDKEMVIQRSRIIFNPGLIGLVAVESLFLNTPIVGDKNTRHSPEIDYLVNHKNCILIDGPKDAQEWAEILLSMLAGTSPHGNLSGLRFDNSTVPTVTAMADNFCNGLLSIGKDHR